MVLRATRLTYNPVVLNDISPPSWIVVASVFGVLEFIVQLWILATCPYKPIGDEIEYIERGTSSNPYRFPVFHRLPVLPTVALFAARTDHPEGALRLASMIFSAIAMATTAGAASRTAGPVVATILCLALLAIPERILLGSRIWPDVYLAAATGGIALALTLAPEPLGFTSAAGLIGLLLASAVLTRLDALVLVPATTVAWVAVSRMPQSSDLLLIVAPPAVAFLGWWLVSKALLGERWPDTTWKFNVGITVQDALIQKQDGPIAVDDLIDRHVGRFNSQPGGRTPTASRIAYVRSFFSRFRAIVGPDTFVTAKLLSSENFGTCSRPELLTTALLRFSCPMLFASSAVLFLWQPSAAGWLAFPSLMLMLPPILFHTRTRYRLPVLYGLVPAAAGSLIAILFPAQPAGSWLIALLCTVAATLILTCHPRRVERL